MEGKQPKNHIVVDKDWRVSMFYHGANFNTKAWEDFIDRYGNKEIYAHQLKEKEK